DYTQVLRLKPGSTLAALAQTRRAAAAAKLAARNNGVRTVSLNSPARGLTSSTSLPVSRQEALRALESFRLGSTLTPARVKALNDQPSGELPDRPERQLSAATRELIAAEQERLAALELEMVAAADVLLRTAKMSQAERDAQG